MRGTTLLFVLGGSLACGPPPPPARADAPSLNKCGDMPAQSTDATEEERVLRVELRSKLPADYELSGVCINHNAKRVPPEGGDAVRLGGMQGGGAVMFPVHVKAKSNRWRIHLHAFALRNGKTHETDQTIEVTPAEVTDGHIPLTLQIWNDHFVARPPSAP